MELDGLLAFGDCRLEITLAERLRLLVADGEKRQGLGVIVLVSFFLFFESCLLSLAAVEIDIEARVERLPETRSPRVLLGGTRGQEKQRQKCCQDAEQDMSGTMFHKI